MTLEDLLLTAFRDFGDAHRAGAPPMREREIVSCFAFGPLLATCQGGRMLYDPRQIGIEVAVPQKRDIGVRRQPDVCKDLVLWPSPGMTTWNHLGEAVHFPMAVIEWKSVFRKDDRRSRRIKRTEQLPTDRAWLEWCTGTHPATEGYLAFTEQVRDRIEIRVDRVAAGRSQLDWWHSDPHSAFVV